MAKNPYAKKDGTPIEGKEFEFFAWAAKEQKDKMKGMTDDQKKSIKAIQDRMKS